MHFYQKNIGDFNNATRHLTRVERSLFSDAIELYYDTEKPLTADINRLERLLLAHSEEEKTALKSVLDEFFILTDDGYFNKRCHEEIVKYHTYMESKSKAGKASAEQRAKQKSTGVEQVLNTTSTKQNQEPLTINKEQEESLKPLEAAPQDEDSEFNQAWDSYPKRPGASKKSAFKAWAARINKGVKPELMLAGVKSYAAYCVAMRTEPNYIKKPETFFGPDEHYLSDWTPVQPQASPAQRKPAPDNFESRDYGQGGRL